MSCCDESLGARQRASREQRLSPETCMIQVALSVNEAPDTGIGMYSAPRPACEALNSVGRCEPAVRKSTAAVCRSL
jgi:hypothetical protein